MLDEFDKHATGITAPALHATALTPSDSTPLSVATRAIYVGTAGNLRVEMVSGDVVTLTAPQTSSGCASAFVGLLPGQGLTQHAPGPP
jgi:uridine phosphorylase